MAARGPVGASRGSSPAGGSGAQLINQLDDAGLSELRDAVIDAIRWRSAHQPIHSTLQPRTLSPPWRDGYLVANWLALALEAGLAADPPRLPEWVGAAADPRLALDVARDWLAC